MKQTLVKTLNYLRDNFWSIIFFGIIAFSTPLFVHAGVGDVVGEALIWILKGPLYLLGQLVVFLIDLLSYLFEFNNFVSVPVVTQGWIVVRDLLNMFFVLIMMIMAIATILPVGALSSYNIKSLMIKLLIATITINFSKTILGVMIDAGQIVMLQFVASFREAIAVNLADGAMLPEILKYADDKDTGILAAIIAMLMGIVFMVIFSFILIIYVGVLLYRIISLWVLIILSPLAFFAQAVPSMASYAKEFWSKFTSQLTIGIVIAFFMWLALTIMYMTDSKQDWMSGQGTGVATQLQPYNTGGSQGGGASSVCESEACDYYKILRFIIAIIILMMAMQYTQKAGGFAGKFAGKMSGKMMALGAGAVGGFGAAKYLKKKGKDLGKKALDRGKALGSTAWQATGGRAMTGLKNKLGTEGGKGLALAGAGGVGMALATGGTLPLAIAAGAAGYGGYKMLKQAYKNRKEKVKARIDATTKAQSIEKEGKGMHLDAEGKETTDTDKIHATWDKESQSYKTKSGNYKEMKTTKKVYEGDNDYSGLVASVAASANGGKLNQEKVGERKYAMVGNEKTYEDENSAVYKNLVEAGAKTGADDVMKSYYEQDTTKRVYEGEEGYDNLGKEEYDREYVEMADGSKFYKEDNETMYNNHLNNGNGRAGTEKATRQKEGAQVTEGYQESETVEIAGKKVQRYEEFNDGGVKRRYDENSKTFREIDKKTGEFVDGDKGVKQKERILQGGLASFSDANAAMWQANKSKFMGATEKAKQEKVDQGVSRLSSLDESALKKLVTSSGSHEDRKFAALALAKKGAVLDETTLAAANKAVSEDVYAKKQFNTERLKAGNAGDLGENVEKITEAIEKGMLKISELKVTDKNLTPSVLEAMFRTYGAQTGRLLDELGKDAKTKAIINAQMKAYLQKVNKNNALGNKDATQGLYAKRTGKFSEAFSPTSDGQNIDTKKLADFFKKNGSKEVLQKIDMGQLEIPEIKIALTESNNPSLFSNMFNNENISSGIKEKIAEILDQSGKEWVNKLRKGNAGVYFKK